MRPSSLCRATRASRWIGALLTGAALLAAGPAGVARADVGSRDFAFTATSVGKPTGSKPQSKLWFAGGVWWGSLFDQVSQAYHVFRYDPTDGGRWVDTGTPLDARNSSHADTLWDGAHLYVASASEVSPDILVTRLSFDAVALRWSVDAGFPRTVAAAAPVEAVVIDKDTTGRLWMTYTQQPSASSGPRTVYVAHTSGPPGDAWEAAQALPVARASDLSADDISAVVAYDRRIGVMWSDQTGPPAMYFASHADGAPDSAWTRSTALDGAFSADDHINLKSIQADAAGRVFAAVKTSRSDDPTRRPTDDQVDLLELDRSGTWSRHLFGTVTDDHTRPVVMTDQKTRRLYVMATSPTVANGHQTIYYKVASLDDPSFAPGPGTVLMRSDSGQDINDVSSTKQDLGSAPEPGLLAVASDFTNYWHNALDLGHVPAPASPPPGASAPGIPVPGILAPTPPSAPDRTALRLSGLSIRPAAFRVRKTSRTRGGGTSVRYRLSEPATVRLSAERAAAGRRVGGRCVPATRGNRRARPCARHVAVPGVLTRASRPGLTRVGFAGRLAGRALRPGAYRLVLRAADAAGNRATSRAAFRVLPDRPSR